MRMRRFGFALVSLALLLASTAGMVGHDHASEFDRGEYGCAVDHAVVTNGSSGGHGFEIEAAGKAHRHDCLGCHFSGQRVLSAAEKAAASALLLAAEPIEHRSLARRTRSWTSRAPRGPPTA